MNRTSSVGMCPADQHGDPDTDLPTGGGHRGHCHLVSRGSGHHRLVHSRLCLCECTLEVMLPPFCILCVIKYAIT